MAVSSIEGLQSNPYIPAYCASKAGMLGLTPKASFITGTHVVIDGGVTCHHP